MTRDDFRFFHRLRVRWAEVDMQRIVFNAHYLMYFDTAVADYWRALAMPYDEAMELLEGDIFLKKAGVEFHASARMDEMLDVALKCSRVGNSSMAFTGAIFRGEQLLITCELLYVFADPKTQTSRPVPPKLREMLAGYEAGEPLVDVRLGGWDELGSDARRIRTEVFIDEQRIPAELEWDEADLASVHAVAYNRLGQAIATGRLLPAVDGSAKVGRMAVNKVLRGWGFGEQVLRALAHAAARRGDRELVLHAQRTAIPFYARLGFAPRGESFVEAGIPHQEMTAALPLAD
ncbi:MAG TPA: YbgC/FadM family acyl-CoA thioesterase [Ramlibacter sp.]|uniref:YbgC/FadM family acyl-CoA thioesterase n=1 Tax=Ramlibacter sp. TaxID=1917967 RepID=UPI002CCE80D6|nr:YbgC/FadM family acyl-CoA thioesterase [Ramlibacter sp.]HVZ43612.1 YbgC/FadM family acyl-CoA thioesterase [Ramlibacter sp.]